MRRDSSPSRPTNGVRPRSAATSSRLVSPRQSEHAIRRHGLTLAADTERASGLDGEEAAHQAVRGFADQHLAGRRQRLQSRRQVRGVADGGVVHLLVTADRTDHDRTGVDPDPHLERQAMLCAQPGIERGERVADGERGTDTACRRVLVRNRRAEEGHEPVARQYVHHAFEAVDLGEGDVDVVLDQVVVLLGVEPLGDRDRADQVAEQHRDLLALAVEWRRCGDGVRSPVGAAPSGAPCGVGPAARRSAGRQVAADRRSAVRTEAVLRLQRGAARVAARACGRAALVAELLPRDQFDAARDAAHAASGLCGGRAASQRCPQAGLVQRPPPPAGSSLTTSSIRLRARGSSTPSSATRVPFVMASSLAARSGGPTMVNVGL